MPQHTDSATSGPPFGLPLATLRLGWRRRIEAGRLSFGSYDTWRTWLVIAANPAISSFCERPAYVDRRSAVIDCWVQIAGHPSVEFWLIEDHCPLMVTTPRTARANPTSALAGRRRDAH